jgi:DNA-binding protein Fis
MERVAMLATDPVVRSENILRTLETFRRELVDRPVLPLAEVERDMIENALRHFGGNRTRAAAALGISRRTLQIKLKRYASADAP